MRVSVSKEGEVLRVGQPKELFRGEYSLGFYLEGGAWDVSLDGERFLVLRDRFDANSLDTEGEMR